MAEQADRTEVVRKAIAAHMAWKMNLRAAAKRGQCKVPPEVLSRDDQCDFGKWLKEFEKSGRMDAQIVDIKEMHRLFHLEAGRIAAMIDDGKGAEATEALAENSEFMARSKVLTKALSTWGIKQSKVTAPRQADGTGAAPAGGPGAAAEGPGEALRKAIGAHGAWKLKLRTAAQIGNRDLPVENIGRDDRCAFGAWLAASQASLGDDPHLPEVKALHARFHREAGRIAGLIRDGQGDRANAALSDESEFGALSQELSRKLAAWKRELR